MRHIALDPAISTFDFSGFVFPARAGVFRIADAPVTFGKPVSFREAVFRGGADFTGCIFEGDVDFFRATFGGEKGYWGGGDFERCTFKGTASFWAARFIGDAGSNPCVEFHGATFLARAEFNSVEFLASYATFDRATFSTDAWFSQANFAAGASFSKTRFCGNVDFIETIFAGTTNFGNAVFQHDVHFVECKFPREAVPDPESVFCVKALFLRDVEFAEPEKVEFRGQPRAPIDLRAVSFLSTDVEKVVFVDESWGPRRALGAIPGASRLVLVDEELIEPTLQYLEHPLKQSLPTYEKVKQLYRRLRKNYEAAGRYAEAGDFFVGEMEMRRLGVRSGNAVTKWLGRNLSFIGLYKHLSLYGESYVRLVLWSFALIVFFTVARLFTIQRVGVPVDGSLLAMQFIHSIAAFFQFPREDSILDLVERVLSAPLIGLLLVSLKRNFERK